MVKNELSAEYFIITPHFIHLQSARIAEFSLFLCCFGCDGLKQIEMNELNVNYTLKHLSECSFQWHTQDNNKIDLFYLYFSLIVQFLLQPCIAIPMVLT